MVNLDRNELRRRPNLCVMSVCIIEISTVHVLSDDKRGEYTSTNFDKCLADVGITQFATLYNSWAWLNA